MPVLHLSSRLSGGVLFQPLPSARQQILFHNSTSLKSSEIVIHDTTILERMQEVSSCIPENGKCGIASAPPSIQREAEWMGVFVYVRLLFCFITAYAPEKVDVGVFWTSFLEKFFRFDEKNSCAYPSCMLYWWCIYHPGMALTMRSPRSTGNAQN